MPKVDEFDTFYDSTSRYVTHLAYAVSGDRVATASAVREAYEHTWRHWPKVRTTDPLAHVRDEAFRLARVAQGTHPWRRRHEDDSDTELLDALGSLAQRSRRLVVLQTLGELDLSAAAREVQMTDEAAVAATQEAVSDLENELGQGIGQIEGRLLGLAEISRGIALPAAADIRRVSRRRGRRNTSLLVAAAGVAVVAAGLAVAPTEPLSPAAAQDRDRVGEAAVADAQAGDAITSGSLLTATEVAALGPRENWTTVASTSQRASSSDAATEAAADESPLTACAPERWATKNPSATLLREFEASGRPAAVTQTIEVARNPEQARQAYEQHVEWFADCAVPGVRMIDAATVRGAASPTTIVQLKTSKPSTTLTVGLTTTGVATTFLVHSTSRGGAVRLGRFAHTLTESARLLCANAEGPCPEESPTVVAAPLPPTSSNPAYLALVDLPSVKRQTKPWGATDPAAPRPNPAATLCDNATFSRNEAKGLASARSRVYVIPNDKAAPDPFSVAETIARFRSEKQAASYVARLERRIDRCEDRVEAASVSTTGRVRGPGYRGDTWRIAFETGPKARLYYHLALVRRGNTVAEVAQAGSKRVNLTTGQFAGIADRAGQRLANSQD